MEKPAFDGEERALFVTGPIGRHLRTQAVPLALGFVAIFGFWMADSFFIAQLGTIPLAAITLTSPITWLIYGMSFGIGIGVASVVSRGLGSGDMVRVQRAVMDSLLLGIAIVLILMVVGLLTIDPLFRLMGGNDRTMPYVRDYMSIWYWGIFTLVVPFLGMNAIRAAGDMRAASRLLIFSSLANFTLDPLLIFGLGPLPGFGMQGAAMATVLAQVIALMLALRIMKKKRLIALTLPNWEELFDSWRRVLHVGAPACSTEMIFPLVLAIIMAMIASFGDEALAGFGIANRIEMVATIPIMALNTTMGPFAGQNFGAGRMGRVSRAMKIGIRFVLIYGLSVAALLALGSNWLPSLFDPNPEVVDVAQSYLLIVPVTYAMMGACFTMISTLNALGYPRPTLVLNIGRMVLLYVPLAWVLKEVWGENGIFAAMPLSFAPMLIATWIWYIHIMKKLAAGKLEARAATSDD